MSTNLIDESTDTLRTSLQQALGVDEVDLHALVRTFHNQKLKKLEARPRRVHISQELREHPLYKNEKRDVIDEIIQKASRGEDLSVYLTERTEQLQHYDMSLAHLGTHHLHLGEKIQKKGARAGRVKGTRSLLFCLVEESDIYFLDIFDHGKSSGFLNVRAVRVLFNNWPETIESFRMKHVLPGKTQNDEEIAQLLDKNINVPLTMSEDMVYMLPGMGSTTAGTPSLVEHQTNQTLIQLEIMVETIQSDVEGISKDIESITGARPPELRLRVRLVGDSFQAYDASSGCIFFVANERLHIGAPGQF